MPAVSVIMPAYNAADYLEIAVASVLRQTYVDWELLIVDDGSTDGTTAVAASLAAADSRVRLLRQENAGPGPARNTAFRHANGRYFAFLDSDDEWEPSFLAAQVSLLDTRPDIDVVIGNAWNRGGAADGRPARPVRGLGRPITLAEILADENVLFIMATFRREAVEAVGGFDPALLTNEEYDMWIRASLAGFTFARNPTPCGWYRSRAGSLSSSETRMLRGILRVLAKTRPLLAPQSPERTLLDRQAARFEAELAAAEMREAIAQGDGRAAARHLAALRRYRGNWALGAAQHLLDRLPGAALAALRVRQRLRGTA